LLWTVHSHILFTLLTTIVHDDSLGIVYPSLIIATNFY
jgi:hypothetical protein